MPERVGLFMVALPLTFKVLVELENVRFALPSAEPLLITSVAQASVLLDWTVTVIPIGMLAVSPATGVPALFQVEVLFHSPLVVAVNVAAKPVDAQRKVASSASGIRANAFEPRRKPERADSVVRGSSEPINFFISFQIASTKESSRRPLPGTVEVQARQLHQYQPAAFPALFSS